MAKRVVKEPIWQHQNSALEINVTKRYGCYLDILKATKGQLDAMQSRYSRVLVVRIDLHVYEYTGSNTKLSKMLRRLKEWLADKYDMKHSGHIWVREVEKAKRQHYHLALMLDGHKVRYPQKVIEWVEDYWIKRNEPKPYTPRACYTMVARGSAQSTQKAFYRLSYLAKERGKGYKDQQAKDYSASRIKPAMQ